MKSYDEALGSDTMTMREVLDRRRRCESISSGSKAIDELLRGGYTVSELVEIYGESKTGKTQLALQAALTAASRGYDVLFVDTEGTFRPERIESMARARGLDAEEAISRVFCVRASDTSAQAASLKLLTTRRELSNCRIVIVDTLTKNFALEYPGRANVPRRQGLLDAHLGAMRREAFFGERAVLLTNRVTVAQGETGSREVHVGGRTVRQMVNHSIHLTRLGEGVQATLEADGTDIQTARGMIDTRGFN